VAGLDPVFQHDQFVINTKLAVADKRIISDSQGKPLLLVTSRSRLGRLVLGLLAAVAVFMVLDFVVVLLLIPAGELDFTSMVVLLVTLMLLCVVVAIMVFFAILGRPHYRFLLADGTGPPFVRMQPHATLGFSTRYTVTDGQGVCLGRLRTNHITNGWRTRWYAEDASGTSPLVVEEQSAVPGFVRRPLRSGVGLVLLVLAVGGILLGIALIGHGGLGLFLLVLFWLLQAGTLFMRWMLPDYAFYKADRESVVAVLRDNQGQTGNGRLLDLASDQGHYLDRRLALALAVVLFEQ
jgi:hypothetical protein